MERMMKKSTLFVLLAVVALALVAWVGCTTKAAVEAPAEATTAGLNVIAAKWAGSAHADAASEAFPITGMRTTPRKFPRPARKCHSSTVFQDYIAADGSQSKNWQS